MKSPDPVSLPPFASGAVGGLRNVFKVEGVFLSALPWPGISSWQVLSLVVPESVKYGVYVQLSRPLGLCVILARLFLAAFP